MSSLSLKCFQYKPAFAALEYNSLVNALSSAVNGETQLVRVPLMPLGGENMVTIRARLIRVGSSPLACRPSDCLDWSEEVTNGQVAGVNIHERTPPAPDWLNTTTAGESTGALHLVAPNIHPEDTTPEISSPADALWYGDWNTSFQVTSLYPGEALTMQAAYRLNLPVTGAAYYSTIAVTSGIVTDKLPHPDIPDLFVYYVTLEDGGEIGELYPTDFLEYQIDDRVAVIKATSESETLIRQPGLLRTARIGDVPLVALRPAPLRFL